ncbi:MAG: family 1 glycosylhydrolase [Candidatus Babeliales bacterium]
MNCKKKFIFFTILSLVFSCIAISVSSKKLLFDWNKEKKLDWQTIDLNDATFWSSLTFPKKFSWGVASSAFQIEGVQTHHNQFVKNNWTEDPVLGEYFKNTKGMDHWNQFKKDVQLIAKAGFNTYRFSIPWDKIEPEEGKFDQEAMNHYIDLVKELEKYNIAPWVCLFHFTLPVWFAQKEGFEKAENNQYFVRFCNYVFDNLPQVDYWISYNEPVAYAMEGYFRGTYPPHKTLKKFTDVLLNPYNLIDYLKQPGIVLKNMLNAHIDIYKEFKRKRPNIQFGIINMFHPLDPYNSWNPLEIFAAKTGNALLHDSLLNFFKNGHFNWFGGLVNEKNNKAPNSLDFIGVNYYRHEIIQVGPTNIGTLKARQSEQQAPDNNNAIYPEGLYRSIVKAATLGLPIYITENGIADSTDQIRNEFIKKHLYIVNKAIADGFDIRGYHYWTLLDSLGWKKGYGSKYGIYQVNPETYERSLRDGAKPLVQFLNKIK